ncbi:MAG: beta-ketoacyl-ACP synthase III [Candidatus Sericytochromatia bacterium]
MTTMQEPAPGEIAVRTIPVQLTGVGYAVPEQVLSNEDLAKLVETSDEWIATRTGIRERRILPGDQTLWSLCVPAARQALAQAQVDPADLDLIIVATSSPDYPMPSTAALVQAELGALRAACFDMEAACSGYVYGLAVAKQFIATGMYRNVLLIAADMLSRFMDYTDRGTCILFGDGAGATVLQAGRSEGVLSTILAADGRGAVHLDISPNAHEPAPPDRAVRQSFMHMNGKEIYKFVVDVVPPAIEKACAQAGITPQEVDFYILHQANMRILEAVSKRLGLGEGRMLHNISKYGNTSAASIPLVLGEAVEAGTVKPGDKLCLVGFGSGLTWGAAIVEWTGGPTA